MAIVFAWIDSRVWDWIAFVISGAIVAVAVFAWPLAGVAMPGSVAVTQILAAGSITMIGFTVTVLALIVGQLSTALSRLDQKWVNDSAAQVKKVVFRPLPWLAAILTLCLISILFQGDADRFLAVPLSGCVVAAVSAIARNVWIIRRLATVDRS